MFAFASWATRPKMFCFIVITFRPFQSFPLISVNSGSSASFRRQESGRQRLPSLFVPHRARRWRAFWKTRPAPARSLRPSRRRNAGQARKVSAPASRRIAPAAPAATAPAAIPVGLDKDAAQDRATETARLPRRTRVRPSRRPGWRSRRNGRRRTRPARLPAPPKVRAPAGPTCRAVKGAVPRDRQRVVQFPLGLSPAGRGLRLPQPAADGGDDEGGSR